MLIGIIMYISLFKSEIGSKLRPKSVFQPPLFTYKYGHSFILFVVGCISAEIVGTLNFFLFIRIREVGREKVYTLYIHLSRNILSISLGLMPFHLPQCCRQYRASYIRNRRRKRPMPTNRNVLWKV